MLLAYALVDAPPPRPLVDPIAGAVRAVGSGPYALVREAAVLPEIDLDILRAHHEVVVEACAGAACLPCRFGARFADEEAARAWLEERQAELTSALARVAQRCEFDLREPAPERPAAADGEGPGTRYLTALRARYAERDPEALRVVAEAARRQLVPHVVDFAVDAESGGVAFLVDRGSAAEFARATRSWSPGPGWRWSGPWPVYTFASTWLAEP